MTWLISAGSETDRQEVKETDCKDSRAEGRGGKEGGIHLEQGLHHATGDQRFSTGVIAGQVIEE